MNALQTSERWIAGTLCAVALALATNAHAFPPPATGIPVPELAQFDTIMQDFMNANGIDAGVLGILRNDCIVYMRGFGWDNAAHTVLLLPDQMLRLASVTKPVVAAATVLLDQQLGGTLLGANAFNLGQPGGGVLNLAPWPALGDNRLANVRVTHLINHRGGWEKDEPGVPDWTYKEVTVANAMGVPSPPSRTQMVRFILGQPLQFNPGNVNYVDPNGKAPYSNINYLVLGLIIEQLRTYPDNTPAQRRVMLEAFRNDETEISENVVVVVESQTVSAEELGEVADNDDFKDVLSVHAARDLEDGWAGGQRRFDFFGER